MAIKTQYGNDVMPIEAITDDDTGEILACFARRSVDGQKRFYDLSQLRAPGGIAELVTTLEQLPKRTNSELLAHETY